MSQEKKHIVLKTTDLKIGYTSKKSAKTIAQNINIDTYKGEFICLLGQNGIGKSTLLRTLSKVQPKLNGSILMNNQNLEDYSNLELSKNISLVLTEKLPESNLSVLELIALGRQPYTNWIGKLQKKDIEKIEQAIQLTNIEHLKSMKHHQLSDGQLQKVLITRALAQDTSIIILDEPTAHLDVQHTMETFELLKNLAKELNKTIIVSTHQIHLALQTATKLWLMTPQQLKSGTPESLIISGEIQSLFNSDVVQFDAIKRQFSLKK